MIFAAAKLVDGLAKLIGYFSSAGRMARGWIADRRQKREFIARRKQFLRVLEADLGGIAKSEAWNDQHYTDLEAEVEIEGSYYPSALKRLLKIRSSGLRRVPSLIKALDNTADRCLLVVGEPGAGKSVALRHLAHQLIERAKASKSEKSHIPLYVNLRELVVPLGVRPSVDTVKQFVIDNVRRGDADTAQYISDNWRLFHEQGVWFFLFDSFDEIPAVLHAASGDQSVADYSLAIRQFMEGLGDCRGVVASREYKSPKSLQWPKLRILQLSDERQEELIDRTFLTSEQRQIALRHISINASSTFRNPLFLTLLARYVREHGHPPANEHQLLLTHVASLARRDARYVEATWGLRSEDLSEAAELIARLFATDEVLGLSPTFSEVEHSAVNHRVAEGVDIPRILEALSYVKIGRTDVQSADPSVRRFAFGHRRYQEALFAKMLIDDPDLIPVKDLVLDPRWREYSVAVLQVGDGETARSIIRYSAKYLAERFGKLPIKHNKYFGVELATYHWRDEELRRVLALLQEGLRFSRIEDFNEVAGSINKIASKLWSKGDPFDRLQVMRYCSAVRPDDLARRVEAATGSGLFALEESGVNACKYVASPAKKLADWVRLHVLSRLLTAGKRFDFLRWEAIASELPQSFEIAYPMGRVRELNKAKKFLFFFWAPLIVLAKVMPEVFSDFRISASHNALVSKVRLLGLGAFYFASLVGAVVIGLVRNGVQAVDFLLMVPMLLLFAYFVRCGFQVLFLPSPSRLGVVDVLRGVRNAKKLLSEALVGLVLMMLLFTLPGWVVIFVARAIGFQAEFAWQLLPVASGVVISVIAVSSLILIHMSERRAKMDAAQILDSGVPLSEIARNAGAPLVGAACTIYVQRSDSDLVDGRRALSVLAAREAGRLPAGERPMRFGGNSRGGAIGFRNAMNVLLEWIYKICGDAS